LASTVVGGIALISSLIILHWSLECSGNYEIDLAVARAPGYNPACTLGANDKFENFLTVTGMDAAFGLDVLRYDSIKTLIYLKIALSDYLSLFNSRCQGWFFSRMPSWHVMVAAVFSTVCSSLLSRWWPLGSNMTGISAGVIGFVWLYTICWGLIQDACKVFTYWVLTWGGEHALVKKGNFINEEEINKRIDSGRQQAQDAAVAREKESIVVIEELPLSTAK